MEVELYSRNNIFILGAGASKEYGLPVWNELDFLIRQRLQNNKGTQYPRSKDVLAWLDKVGEKNIYKTIDECIKEESISGAYHVDGDSVENELFLIIKDIFNESRIENKDGWIRRLNDKILHGDSSLEDKIAFISSNYDNVLEENLLKFEYVAGKLQRINRLERLKKLAECNIPVLYTYGNLYKEEEISPKSHTTRNFKTMKTGLSGYVDVVSCHENHERQNHLISNMYVSGKVTLYILGLGGGLELNLKRLFFDKQVSKICITISDQNKDQEITDFLVKKFSISKEKIHIYRTCIELIDKCF